jgi:hypothetical protein
MRYATPEASRRASDWLEAWWRPRIERCPGPTLVNREIEEKNLRLPGIRRFFGRRTIRVRIKDIYRCRQKG